MTSVKGGVRIYQAHNLCHVTTVNWTQLGVPPEDFIYDDENVGEAPICPKCPEQCNGKCVKTFFLCIQFIMVS